MELRKNQIRKEDPTMRSSRLFGIIDRAGHIKHKKKNASSKYYANWQAEKTVRDTMLQAEFRKSQSRTSAFMNEMNR